jgi:DNA gyrase subunit A
MPRQEELMPYAREVIDVPVSEEMSESFLAYSLSVITARAIPDVRDGLKPVQRRILFAMHSMGIRPDNPHRKSARVVGETMGRYHPHGDQAIYDALVRMGWDFARAITLIDPHGNFGSLDDPPAASRYTECRLTEAAMEMIGEIGEDTVDFRPTYDGDGEEPEYLPGKLPNLLVNGTSGIAVGMATNMPSHNLAEIYEAVKLCMKKRRPKPTIDELMEVVPGPDFASGGIIIDDGLREAYQTGRGSFRVRALCEIGAVTARKQGITVAELPFMIGPEAVVRKIQDAVNSGKINGITDVKNLGDRKNPVHLVVECKTGVNPNAILAQLYRLTPLEISFGINNVALVDGVPTTLGLLDMCTHYIDHRLDVVVRRTRYRLRRAQERLHIVEGLLIALENIDEVVAIIRSSQDTPQARERLMESFDLSEIQATTILEMPLRRLTALETQKLIDEQTELLARIDGYGQVLGSEQRRRTLVLKELEEMVGLYGHERRTLILGADEVEEFVFADAPVALEIGDHPCVLTLSTTGLMGREPIEGAKRTTFGRHDVLAARIPTTNHATVAAITSGGRSCTVQGMEVPEVAGRSRGAAVSEIFSIERGETVLTLVDPVGPDSEGRALLLVTRDGVAKRVAIADLVGLADGRPVIKLKGNDRVVAAMVCSESDEVVIVANDAQALRTPVEAISLQGSGAGGVAGIKLKGDAKVVAAGLAEPGAVVLTVTDTSTAKVTDIDEIPPKGRGTSGLRLTKFGKERRLDLAAVGPAEGLTLLVGQEDAPSKVDNRPEPLSIEPTKRDLTSKKTDRRILAAGEGRW